MNHGMDSDETMEGAEDSPEQQPAWWVFLDADKKKTETPDGKDFVTLGVVFPGAMRIRNWPSIRLLRRTLDKEDLTLFWLHPRNQWILCWG